MIPSYRNYKAGALRYCIVSQLQSWVYCDAVIQAYCTSLKISVARMITLRIQSINYAGILNSSCCDGLMKLKAA